VKQLGKLDTLAKIGTYLDNIQNVDERFTGRAIKNIIPITVDMVMQEINRYADSEFRYADKSDEIAIENMVRDFGRQEEAKKRYLKGKG